MKTLQELEETKASIIKGLYDPKSDAIKLQKLKKQLKNVNEEIKKL